MHVSGGLLPRLHGLLRGHVSIFWIHHGWDRFCCPSYRFQQECQDCLQVGFSPQRHLMLGIIDLKDSPDDHSLLRAGSTTTPTLRGMWMKTAGATASPRCCMKRAGFLCRSPQITAPRSAGMEPGSQVAFPQNSSSNVVLHLVSQQHLTCPLHTYRCSAHRQVRCKI